MEVVESIVYGLLFKSPDWSYEREWRIIGMDMDTGMVTKKNK